MTDSARALLSGDAFILVDYGCTRFHAIVKAADVTRVTGPKQFEHLSLVRVSVEQDDRLIAVGRESRIDAVGRLVHVRDSPRTSIATKRKARLPRSGRRSWN